jgi:hypothetical protein
MGLLGASTNERDNCVISLLTVDETGHSRVCLLSPYQVIATTDSLLHFEVYRGSRTSKNLDRSANATLVIPELTGLLYVRGKVTSEQPSTESPQNTLLYLFRINQVESDVSVAAPIYSQMRFDTSVIGKEYRHAFEQMKDLVLKSTRES